MQVNKELLPARVNLGRATGNWKDSELLIIVRTTFNGVLILVIAIIS